MTDADLLRRLGIGAWKPHQRIALGAVREGRDVLVVAPTGGGKTHAFLAAGLVTGGVTLVVCPLRALISDQERRLKALGLPVCIWNSDVSRAEKVRFLRELRNGWEGFFYTTPESLRRHELQTALFERVGVAIIDETDCVLNVASYRPHYAAVGKVLDYLSPKVRYACTATLPYEDRGALISQLGLRSPLTHYEPVKRANLKLRVADRTTNDVAGWVRREECGVVYCATVAGATRLADKLGEGGFHVELFHGKLDAAEKDRVLKTFIESDCCTVVATDAFGRGIDKPDIRWVVHYDLPASIEEWVQGFGRAGRDGNQACAVGCFGWGSEWGRSVREMLVGSSHPSPKHCQVIWTRLKGDGPFTGKFSVLCERVAGTEGRYGASGVGSILHRLGLLHAVRSREDGRVWTYTAVGSLRDMRQADWGWVERLRARALGRLAAMNAMAHTSLRSIPQLLDAYFDGSGVAPRVGVGNTVVG